MLNTENDPVTLTASDERVLAILNRAADDLAAHLDDLASPDCVTRLCAWRAFRDARRVSRRNVLVDNLLGAVLETAEEAATENLVDDQPGRAVTADLVNAGALEGFYDDEEA
jgi:hypothetical protein